MLEVKTLVFTFLCNEKVHGSASKLRGFFADQFDGYTLIHHHLSNQRFLYKTPLVQYKVVKEKPLVIGINEGADILYKIHNEIDFLKIDDTEYQIIERRMTMRFDRFGVVSNLLNYELITPWLALNERNYQRYKEAKDWAGRKSLLESILIGNLISLSKTLGYTVPDTIKAKFHTINEVRAKSKNVWMTGFTGRFSVNFNIPDLWGIGKSVSKGFGTIKKCNELG
ncbi:MAG: hypothetical protein D6735_04825 [Acidobacteria bacterium]|nr:MAG: hypothetical protein D6735_04825 [Acidobacteriota bacterium]